MSFLNTVPAAIRPREDFSTWNRFHVGNVFERADWLRKVCQSDVPVSLGLPAGDVLTTSLWSVDVPQEQLHFSAEVTDANRQALERLADAPEVWGAVYIDDQKLQFLMSDLSVATKDSFLAISCRGPQDMYRLARRQGQRIKGKLDDAPLAQIPLTLAATGAMTLRVADVSLEGCGLRQRSDDWALTPGSQLHGVEFEFDELTYLVADLEVLHVTPEPHDPTVLRVGCRWIHMSALAQQVLQRWVRRGRRPRDLLSLDL
jgi:c-di-GMP-binding flagellar brake protein YcgR